jgi:exodeoxyribonuclease VIII
MEHGSPPFFGQGDHMLPRIYSSLELSSQAYHEEGEHVSSTRLKLMLTSPAHYLAAGTEPAKDSSAFQTGSVVHAAVLEPNTFDEFYAVCPKYDRRTTKGKQDYNAFLDQHPGKRILMAEDMDMFNKIRKSIISKPDVHKLLGMQGHSESSIFGPIKRPASN